MTLLSFKITLNQLSAMLFMTSILMFACDGNQAQTSSSNDNSALPKLGIHEAVFTNNIEALKQHIKANSDLNKKDDYGSTPLSVAATFNKVEAAKLLIKGGANINETGADGSTPLHTASFFCRTEIVQALLDAGANKEIQNNFGATPLASVSAPFNDVKMIYEQLNRDLGPFGLKLDYDQLKSTRPVVAEMLSKN